MILGTIENSAMKRPQYISPEMKLKEAALIRRLIEDSPYTQEQVAAFLGTKQSSISPWLSSKHPNAIPDWSFLRLAEILNFDPSVTRPWLWHMYLISDRVFKKTKANTQSARELLAEIVATMTPEEAFKAAGAVEEAARRMLLEKH